ncbi:MAG: ABC transporter substrate-binding protein [Pseudomonadota bacterium]|nr:ABC transporter substrate-binding protein [Pseudomonadota bacterium]
MLISLILLDACEQSYHYSTKQRQERALKTQEKIVIGISWPLNNPCEATLVEGAQVAVDILNAENPKRTIQLKIADESFNEMASENEVARFRAQQERTFEIARAFADDLDVIAVIGHRYSSQAIQASITYENHGIVFLAPTATHLSLNHHNFNYVFRLVPNNEEIGTQMANYVHQNEYKRVAVLYERTPYAEELAQVFIQNAQEKFNIVFKRSFFSTETRFTKLLVELVEQVSSFLDAIFLVTGGKKACQIIKQAEKVGIDKPFVGSDALLSAELEHCSSAAQGTVVPLLIDKDRINSGKFDHLYEKFKKFAEKRQQNCSNKEKHSEPQSELQRLYLGYDAVSLLSYIIEEIETTVPIEIATHLRYTMTPWKAGIIGNYAFQEDGNLKREDSSYFAILCPRSADEKQCQKLKKENSKCFFTRICEGGKFSKESVDQLTFTTLYEPFKHPDP